MEKSYTTHSFKVDETDNLSDMAVHRYLVKNVACLTKKLWLDFSLADINGGVSDE